MTLELVCDYCHRSDQKYLYFISLTNVADRSNACTKVICDKCAERLGMILDAILDKRDIDEALKEIEGDILEEE